MSTIDKLADYWDQKARSGKDHCERVDSSKRTQLMRFEAFISTNDLAGCSILDVGCGTGDFWERLQYRKIKCDYLGVDLSPEMARISQERYPAARFESANILAWDTSRQFDFVTAFAIHNVVVPEGWELLSALTRRQFELCRIGTHLSLLTDRFGSFAEHIQPWSVERVLALALEITPYVSVQHHYLPHDFGITLYREPLIDRCPELVAQ